MATLTKGSRLEILEHEINTEAFETFYHIGKKLLEIKKGRLYERAGFKTWGSYCASGRIDYGRCHADRTIRCAELRYTIGTIVPIDGDWTQSQMLELCKCATDNDVKRVAKKAISLAKKTGERVTARLIAMVRDGDDETGAASNKKGRELDSASLATHLGRLSDKLVDWRVSLEQVDLEQWSELDPVILTRFRAEAKQLHDFARS